MNKTSEIVIIGGGVIGTSIAYNLSKKGKKVILVEKGDLAFGASGSCDQEIILQSKSPGVHLQMAMRSAEIYKTLEDELNHPIEYKNTGGMIIIETEEEMKTMEGIVEKQKKFGFNVEILDRNEAAKLQGGLAEHLQGSTYSPQDAHINSMELTIGYANAAKKLGAEVILNTEVTGIKQENRKITGVQTSDGDIDSEIVINCAGAWAPAIAQMAGINIPIQPRRGQIIITEEVPPYVMGDILSARYIAAKYNPDILKNSNDPGIKLGVGLALSQMEKGNIMIGATREFVGYDTSVTREGIKEILKYATRLVPGIRDLNIIRVFAGLRPYTPDGLPVIGFMENVEGFFMAAGHEGDGIALAPVTGEIVSDLIIDGKTFIDDSVFDIKRFN
ncbi:MAG: FAD-binding oxidoreductase [Clostridiales bacterium]|nr:FAD-binding oxidoreductase [Clostridiales bacterium]MCF8023829.1 FAD-binding oxidoreductase [Clostridiales bacterium]